MIAESCYGIKSRFIHPPQPPSRLAPQKAFNCESFFNKNMYRRIVAVAATHTQNPCIASGEFVLQSSSLFYCQQRIELGISVHLQRRNKKDDKDLELADMWRELQGSHNWNGMLNPLHPLLLSEILKYGVFVRACYETFDLETGSKFRGFCKYGRKKLLGEAGMEKCGYQVTKYIYATPGINIPDFMNSKFEGDRANWIGYVAVTEDEKEIRRLGRRDIVVALRGTATYAEWVANFMCNLTDARLNPLNPTDDVKVEMGFLGLYTSQDSNCRFNNGSASASAREQLVSEIARLVQKYRGEELSITLTGHSMGSALAILCAYDIAELELTRPCTNSLSRIPITVYSFAGPRVGNAAFRDRCEELGLRILRVVNVHDVVTKIPGLIFNENFRLWTKLIERINRWKYCHVGVELSLDHKLYTRSLKPTAHHPSCIHDLATYLQLLSCCGCSNHPDHHEDANSEFHSQFCK